MQEKGEGEKHADAGEKQMIFFCFTVLRFFGLKVLMTIVILLLLKIC